MIQVAVSAVDLDTVKANLLAPVCSVDEGLFNVGDVVGGRCPGVRIPSRLERKG